MVIFYTMLLLAWTFFSFGQGAEGGERNEKKRLNTKALKILHDNRNSFDEEHREAMRFFYEELFKDENK